jgi:hypothetical protein
MRTVTHTWDGTYLTQACHVKESHEGTAFIWCKGASPQASGRSVNWSPYLGEEIIGISISASTELLVNMFLDDLEQRDADDNESIVAFYHTALQHDWIPEGEFIDAFIITDKTPYAFEISHDGVTSYIVDPDEKAALGACSTIATVLIKASDGPTAAMVAVLECPDTVPDRPTSFSKLMARSSDDYRLRKVNLSALPSELEGEILDRVSVLEFFIGVYQRHPDYSPE